MQRARAGSVEAMNVLFARYGERLHALVRLRLGANLRRRLDSRDIVQVTLLKAFQGFDRFEGSGSASLMAWLGRIAHDEICDQADFHGRKRRDLDRETGIGSGARQLPAEVRSEVSRLRVKRETARLERAFDTLSEDYREVILLRGYEELQFSEIGERLGRSPDACRMLYSRAMAALTVAMRSERRGKGEKPRHARRPR